MSIDYTFILTSVLLKGDVCHVIFQRDELGSVTRYMAKITKEL